LAIGAHAKIGSSIVKPVVIYVIDQHLGRRVQNKAMEWRLGCLPGKYGRCIEVPRSGLNCMPSMFENTSGVLIIDDRLFALG